MNLRTTDEKMSQKAKRFQNVTEVTQIIYVDGEAVHIVSGGTVMLDEKQARKYRKVLAAV